ncbi:hypothetical protein STEG23_000028 [Scotinomys teguina]
MQPGRTTNTGGRTMEVKAAAPRCQLLLILLMSAVMLLPGTNGSLLLVQRTVTRTIVLQETISKETAQSKVQDIVDSTLHASTFVDDYFLENPFISLALSNSSKHAIPKCDCQNPEVSGHEHLSRDECHRYAANKIAVQCNVRF